MVLANIRCETLDFSVNVTLYPTQGLAPLTPPSLAPLSMEFGYTIQDRFAGIGCRPGHARILFRQSVECARV